MKHKLWKRLCAALLVTAMTAGSIVSASACTGLYVGKASAANGSTYVGRSEDAGKLYDKVFQVKEAADHEEGELYEDAYGFSMPYPAHTYRYTMLRDSIQAWDPSESITDEDGNLLIEAYGEVGINEKGVSVTATVSTDYNAAAEAADPLGDYDGCLYEISLASVILMQADSARDGVETLAALLDQYGSGECNSLTISDANEVWDVEILSGHQYAALRLPADKVSVNPNMVVMGEIDVSDAENVIASAELISLPLENGFLVSSQDPAETEVTKINIAATYGEEDFGSSQYERYWQGVNYLNEALAQQVSIAYGEDGEAPQGPFDMLFDADHSLTTYEVLRLLAYRGEGTDCDANTTDCYAIGNEYQAECHVLEIRDSLPEALATIQWQAMSRAEYSVYLPFYSSLLTDTSDLFQTEFGFTVDEEYNHYYDIYYDEVTTLMAQEDWPEDSIQWVFIALNDLCDNDRERYGANVKVFWEQYQKALIEQQAAVDAGMAELYAASPALAQEKATALGKAVTEEAFGYAKSILTELLAFIEADEAGELTEEDVFVPTVLTEGKLPSYSMDMEIPADIPQFDDVADSAWYADAVAYVSQRGLMNGTKDRIFAPNSSLTRAMLVQVLFNLEGQPSSTGSSFPDVTEDDWYADAVNWAAENQLVSGYSSGKFGPNDPITREQMATILFRYAQFKGIGTDTQEETLNGFADQDQISAYAVPALNWAVDQGVMQGNNATTLAPKGTATRAQVATVLMNYCEKVANQ